MEVDDEALEAQLLRLCSCGDAAAAALLLCSAPADVLPDALELRDQDKRTPLLAAGAAGSLELVRLLLEAGADGEASDSDGCGLALLAASSGDPELLAWLIHQGLADLTESAHDGSTALLCAASNEAGAVEMLHFLLDGPPGALVVPSLEEQDDRGANALLVAAEAGAVPAAQVLLARGASPESRDARGCCALHYAAAGGSNSMVDFCVKSLKIPVDVVDSDGDTPLMIAAHEGNVEVVRWLLAAGASLEHRNAEGMSPLMAAAAGEQSEVLSLMSQVAGEAVANLWLQDVQHHPQLLLNFLERGL